jgi:ubiquinone/menaquinone biosynthesis C-methylase UbiE
MNSGLWTRISAIEYSLIFERFGGSFPVHPRVVILLGELARRPVRYMGLLRNGSFVAAVPLWGRHIVATASALAAYDASHLMDLGESEIVLPISHDVSTHIPFEANMVSNLHRDNIHNLEPDWRLGEELEPNSSFAIARTAKSGDDVRTSHVRHRELRRFEDIGGRFVSSRDISPDELVNIYITLYRRRKGEQAPILGEQNLHLVISELKDMINGDLLFMKDRPVCMELLFKHQTSTFLFVNGVQRVSDPDFNRYSIGTILTYHNIDMFIREAEKLGKRLRYGFGWKDPPDKALWTVAEPIYKVSSIGEHDCEASSQEKVVTARESNQEGSQTNSLGDRIAGATDKMSRVAAQLIGRAFGRNSVPSEDATGLFSDRIHDRHNQSGSVGAVDQIQSLLERCAFGDISTNMALFIILLYAPSEVNAIETLNLAIDEASGLRRLRLTKLKELWEETPNAFSLVKSVTRAYSSGLSSNGASDAIVRMAAAYDEVSKLSEHGSVALYSLGRDDLLDKATNEVVDYIRDEGLLKKNNTALEIGCGSGRFLVAMAPDLQSIVGIDISENMRKIAANRCRNIANVDVIASDGRTFGNLPRNRFDLIVAVDSFPYIIEAGTEIAIQNIKEIRRVLRPGGRFLMFNFSYRGNDLDRRDVTKIANKFGFDVLRCGECLFHYWNGAIFDLKKH